MKRKTICVYGSDESISAALTGYRVMQSRGNRAEFLGAVGALRPMAAVVDLDDENGLSVVRGLREVSDKLGIVGVTGNKEFEFIVEAQRAGCTQFARKPIDAVDLCDAVERSRSPGGSDEGGRLVAVYGATGGAGATTVAAYLAAELARSTGTRVSLIDLDLSFGGVARLFDLSPKHTLHDIARAGCVDTDLLWRAAETLPSNVDVFARPTSLHDAQQIDVPSLQEMIRVATASYPWTVIDLPRQLDPLTGFVMTHCQRLLLVLQLTLPSVDNAHRLIEALAAEGVDADHIELVINRYRKNAQGFTIEMVEKQLSKKALAILPNDYQSLRQAVDTGSPLSERNPVRAAIAELAAKLVGLDAQPQEKAAGWLASLGFRRKSGRAAT